MPNDTSIEEVCSFTYRSVVINKHLTWQDQIDYICNEINKKLGLLRRINTCLPLDARLIFFNSYILPIFDYADIIWGDKGKAALIEQLQVLKNKAVRIILDLPYPLAHRPLRPYIRWKRL